MKKTKRKMTKVEKARRARIKAGQAWASDVHTSRWWSKKFREYKKYAASRGITQGVYATREEYINAYLVATERTDTKYRRAETVLLSDVRKDAAGTGGHTVAFFDAQYEKMRRYADSIGVEFPWRSRREFISDYRATKASGSERPLDEMRYFLKYSTGYKTALAEYRMSRQYREDWKRRRAEYNERLAKFNAVQDRKAAGEVVPDEEDVEEPEEVDEEEPRAYTFRELQKMTTQEFAEANKDMLRDAYHELKRGGKSSKDAKKWISTYWFGSP